MGRLTGVFSIILTAACFATAQKPPLDIKIQPLESDVVVYSPIAPRSTAFGPTGQIGLLLRIENPSAIGIRLAQVTIAYDGNGGPYTEKVITSAEDNSLPMVLPPHSVMYWNQRRDYDAKTKKTWDTMIYLPFYFDPSIVTVRLSCTGFPQPASVVKAMKKHVSPAAGGSYLFPGKARDLNSGEYWSTASNHATSSYGSQLFAYDVGVIGWDDASKSYTDRWPGTTGCQNTDYRIYGRPVYAMADGEVFRFRNDIDQNPMPFRLLGDTKTSCPTQKEKDDFNCDSVPAGNGSGNYFMIRTGDELTQYAHLQKGTLNQGLIGQPHARVKAGDFLGLVGNAGCSTQPHTHIDALQIHDTAKARVDTQNNSPEIVSLRPLIFHDIYTIDKDLAMRRDPEPEKWTKVENQAIPTTSALIWASTTKPCYYVPDAPEVAVNGLSETSFQAFFDRATNCGYQAVWLDGFEYNKKIYYNATFRYEPNRDGYTVAKQDLGHFNSTRADLEGKGYRLIFVDSYSKIGRNFFSSIYVRDGGPATKVTADLSPEDHEKKVDKMAGDGWYPINVSVFAPLSIGRRITTLYQKSDFGKVVLRSYLSEQEYDDLVDKEADEQMNLFHVDAYKKAGKIYFAAIWHRKTPYTQIGAQHDMSVPGYQNKYNEMAGQGFLTHAVTGYELHNKMTFAGIWVK